MSKLRVMSKLKSETSETVRYFIVERESLSSYGNVDGSDSAEAERLLAESGDGIGDLVVIKGVLIKPSFKLD